LYRALTPYGSHGPTDSSDAGPLGPTVHRPFIASSQPAPSSPGCSSATPGYDCALPTLAALIGAAIDPQFLSE
jgi:hypothetical protein